MTKIQNIIFDDYQQIVFFTGAGMSAESGIPTYRGRGGIWNEYNYEDYACQLAFDRQPEKVLEFHNLRRKKVLSCHPHNGHFSLRDFQHNYPNTQIITQNIDGMHQRAGSSNIVELHGSLWRLRCSNHGIIEDLNQPYKNTKCNVCNTWLRPDITWFGDMLNEEVVNKATTIVSNCDLFISIGTSGVVWPAAGFPAIAKENGARCIEINLEKTDMSYLYHDFFQGSAGEILPLMFSR